MRAFWKDSVGPPRQRAEDVLLRILAGTDDVSGTWGGLALGLTPGTSRVVKRIDGTPGRRLGVTFLSENAGEAPVDVVVRRLSVVSVHGEVAATLAKPEQAIKAEPGTNFLGFSTLQPRRDGTFRQVFVLTVEVGGVARTLRTPPFDGE